MPPSREDFIRWREDPVTRFVLRAFEADAVRQKEEWDSASWVNGGCNQHVLTVLRTRADAYMAMAELNYEGVCEALGETPRDE